MEKQQRPKSWFGRWEKKALFYIIIIGLLFGGGWYALTHMSEKATTINNTLNLDTLRSVTKLVIWEQDFTLENNQTETKKYYGADLLSFSESVLTTAEGTMQFYIDLSDTVRTVIVNTDSGIVIKTPLEVERPNIRLGSIRQEKDWSWDPTIDVDEEFILKRLDTIAMKQYLPVMIANVRGKSLHQQEVTLSKLIGKQVKIIFTEDPAVMQVVNEMN